MLVLVTVLLLLHSGNICCIHCWCCCCYKWQGHIYGCPGTKSAAATYVCAVCAAVVATVVVVVDDDDVGGSGDDVAIVVFGAVATVVEGCVDDVVVSNTVVVEACVFSPVRCRFPVESSSVSPSATKSPTTVTPLSTHSSQNERILLCSHILPEEDSFLLESRSTCAAPIRAPVSSSSVVFRVLALGVSCFMDIA